MACEKQSQRVSERLPRLDEIDRAKGLAIILVVLGHVVAREPPLGAEWYVALKTTLYGFHMAFFMYLSGLVFALGYRELDTWNGYATYVRKRFMRLMPAYFGFALLVWVGKVISARFVHVDNPAGSLNDLINVLLYPTGSFSTFLWFIYALFIICALVPVLLRLCRGDLRVALLVACVVHFLPMPHIFALHMVFGFLPYFLLGCLVMRNQEEYFRLLDHYWVLWIAVFVLALVFLDPSADKSWLGLAAIPALHALVRVSPISHWRFLACLGVCSFSIYLMNSLCIGVAKGVITKFVSWDGANFFWVAPILFIVGILLPILVKRGLFARLPAIDRAT